MIDSSRAKPRSIVHIVSSLAVGGMEQVVVRLATAQKASGHDVAVLALRGGSLLPKLQACDIETYVLGGGRLSRGLNTIRHLRSAPRDIVHVHNPTSLHYGVVATMVSRAALVVTIHGDQTTHARLGSRIEWQFVKAGAVVSRAALQSLELPLRGGLLTTIPNGVAPVDRDARPRAQLRAQLAGNASCLGAMVARIDGHKGHATLLDSLRILADGGVNVSIIIVGDGGHRHEMERRAAELTLDSRRIRFLGVRSDVDALLGASDFFVLPSDTEGMPLSVLEAMAHALPVVATRVGGLPELITDGVHGLLVPPGNPAELAEAIRRVCEDRTLREKLGDAALERASTEFSLARTVQHYDELYERAVAAA